MIITERTSHRYHTGTLSHGAVYPQRLTPGAALLLQAAWMTGIMSLTNVFFIPFTGDSSSTQSCQVRCLFQPQQLSKTLPQGAPMSSSSGSSSTSSAGQQPSGLHHKVAVPGSDSSSRPGRLVWALLVPSTGVFAIYWDVAGRPEFGDLAARANCLQGNF